MTTPERLTPPLLRDLAALFDEGTKNAQGHAFGALSLMRALCSSEAARREAEANELGRDNETVNGPPSASASQPQGEREGPGSAAAPMKHVLHYAADYVDAAGERAHTPREFSGFEPRYSSTPTPPAQDAATDELVTRLRTNNPHTWPVASKETMTEAADRIEAQAREIAELKAQSKLECAGRDWEKARADRLDSQMKEMMAGVMTMLQALRPLATPALQAQIDALSTEGGGRG